MTKILATIATLAVLTFTVDSPPAQAMPLPDVVAAIAASGGHYQWAEASLPAADCSGLVSVAQSLAMGQAPHRLGDTHTLLNGGWPDAIPGAGPGDEFVIGVSPTHMAAQVGGVNIESSGGAYRVGPGAASPFDGQFTRVYHINPEVLTL